jgi:hypothetical protein
MNEERMNDRELDAVLRTWMREARAEQPDRSRVVGNVVGRLGSTRRRRRRWPFSLLRRGAKPPVAAEAPEHQPSPILATNGHAPTVIGRTQTMFSPVKAIVAGALVFALGGMFLIAQPLGQEGSAPGAEQAAEPLAPVKVTGKFNSLEGCTEDEDVEATLAETCYEVDMEWSDPRLQGTDRYLTNSMDAVVSDHEDEDGTFDHRSYIIETEGGTWRMRPQLRVELPDWPDPDGTTWWWVLDGDGDHDGLVAVLTKRRSNFSFGEELHGYIFSSDQVPPPPQGSSTK